MSNKSRIIAWLFIFFISVGSLNAQPISKDKKLGKKGLKMVEETIGIYKDSTMTAYINKLGQKLVSNLDSSLFDYKFYIVNQSSPNAFALPGGYIFITKGLLPIVETEDELACIIAHEIIHSNNRHTIRQLHKRIIPVLLVLPVDIIGALVPGVGAATAPVKASQQLLFAHYSRKFETEADNQGIALAAKAGYDPLALPKVLNRMNEAIKIEDGLVEHKNYFADHPYTPDRVANIKEKSKALKPAKSEKLTTDFVKEFDGLLYGSTPVQGIVRKNTFLHPDLDLFVEFPRRWRIQNTDTAIAAMSPQRDAGIAISLAAENKTPEELAKIYLKGLTKRYKKILKKSEPYKIKDKEGYLVSFQESLFGDTTYAYVLWLPVGEHVYKITGMSNDGGRILLLETVESMRQLTDEEKASIKVQYLTVVKAHANESIEDLGKRTGNMLKPRLTAIINDCDINKPLKEGQEIKIVVEKVYKP